MTDQAALATEGSSYLRPARRPRPEKARAQEAGAPAATAPRLLAFFFLVLLLPLNFSLGSLSLSPIRVLLLLAFVPLVLRWTMGGAGRITKGDILITLHSLWVGLALFAVHGSDRIPFIGITIVEIFGSYLLGRTLIRNATDYQLLFRYFLIALAILAPFVLVEMVTSQIVISEILGRVAATHPKVQAGFADMRMGFFRAQTVFEHPILWGVFCSVGIANVFHIYRDKFLKSVFLTGFVTGMTFTSLSSAPLLSVAVQLITIGWGWITRYAWWVLLGFAVLGYVAIDLLSNRTPVQVLITYLTFNSASAYWRLLIWDFGSAEVLRHPLFGLGLGDWARPDWMFTASVDNFWLLTAMRYGLPAFLLLAAGIVTNLVQIIRADLSDRLADFRRGYVIALVGLAITLCTVHAWGATFVFVMFYIGAGSWLFTETAAEPAGAPQRAAVRGPARPPRAPVRGVPDDPGEAVIPDAVAARSSRGRPTEAERLARRRAQYSGSGRDDRRTG